MLTYTFAELAEKLPELAVGTKFKTDYGSKLYVGHQPDGLKTNKHLFWKSNDTPVAITEVTVKAEYTELSDYIAIDWKEAFELIADGKTVYADDEKISIKRYTDFGSIESGNGNYVADDFEELFQTDWFKKA